MVVWLLVEELRGIAGAIPRRGNDGAAEDEQGVEHPHRDHLIDFGIAELKLLEQVDQKHTDTAVDVEDQVVLLLRCDGLYAQRVVEHRGGLGVALRESLHQLDAFVRVLGVFRSLGRLREACQAVSQAQTAGEMAWPRSQNWL